MSKNVLITGTSSGLGEVLADKFKAAGFNVRGTTAHPGEDGGDQYYYVAQSMGTELELERKLLTDFEGRLDILINNAGVNDILQFEKLDRSYIMNLLEVNFVGPVMLIRRLLPMLVKGDGLICNIISDASWRPMRHSLAYNASKAALAMATKQMARELTKPHGVTIFGVNPGKMGGTKMSEFIDRRVREVRDWTADQAEAYYRANSVTGLEAKPEQVASLIYDLLKDPERCRMLAGSVLDLVG